MKKNILKIFIAVFLLMPATSFAYGDPEVRLAFNIDDVGVGANRSTVGNSNEQKEIAEVVSAFKKYYNAVLNSSVTVKDGIIKSGNAAYNALQKYVKNCNLRKEESELKNAVAKWTDPDVPEIKDGKATYSCKEVECKQGFHLDSGGCVVDKPAGSSGGGDSAVSESENVSEDENVSAREKEQSLANGGGTAATTAAIDTRTPEQKAVDLKEKQDAYDAAREKEQSLANRGLTAATTAAIGIGAMQTLQGLSEQKADKDADADMAAYIATMRCSYGNVSRIDVGNEPIELPGGNNEALMNYRNEYFALAESLKVRKEALGMNPGIESEVILDKANMGLYDQENTGITSGKYASLYRAKMLNSEADKTKIEEDANKSDNRVKYGAIAAGAGVVGGLVGNSAINGKLGELIKEAKGNAANNRANKDVISKIKTALKDAGVKDINKLDFSNLDLSALSGVIDEIDFTKVSKDVKGKSAKDILNTTNKASFVSSFGNFIGSDNLNLLESMK